MAAAGFLKMAGWQPHAIEHRLLPLRRASAQARPRAHGPKATASTSDRRGFRVDADDGDEAGQYDGGLAVPVIEIVRLFQVSLLENTGILLEVDPVSGEVPDPIVDGITCDGGYVQRREEYPEVKVALGREGACREKEGIAGQEGRHHQAGLAGDHKEEKEVGPSLVIIDDVTQGFI